ncbi:ABC transporter ATP-binding protein [Olivibacter ginsenosidimutans]
MKTTQPKNGITRLLEIAGRKKHLLTLSALLAIIYSLLSLIPYILVYHIIQEMTGNIVHVSQITSYLIQAALAMLLANGLLYASGMSSHIAAFTILYELRVQMAEKLAKLPLGFINNTNSGTLKKIMADDIERLENFIAHSIPDIVKGIALPFCSLIYLFTIDWRLALASCLPMVFLALVIPRMFNKDRRELLTQYHQSIEEMNAGIIEFVRAMPVIKIFGHTAQSFDRYTSKVEGFHEMVNRWIKTSSAPYAVFISFISNATLPVLALGLYLYFSTGISLSVFILFLILGVGYIRPLFSLSSLGSQLSVIDHGVKRLDEVLFSKEQETFGEAELTTDFSIAFDHVAFSYDQQHLVLRQVSFDVPQGSITALVGPSGSGKSTLAQLVARFWDVTQGEIRIGGQPIQSIKPEALMHQISFVFQDSFLFQQSIYENIRMGMDKTEMELIAAAKAAQCHDFIMRLPQGYQTRWGADGIHLSGGEQQRIQLARAILKDAPILILDEATAFSDPENEQLIQQAFSQLIQRKTVLVIAHRLSTITDSDQIVVLDKGSVVGHGQHQELLKSCPLYQTMWDAHMQAKTFALT